MSKAKTVTITVDLTEERAAALAQFIKRLRLDVCEAACSPPEVKEGVHYAMQSALFDVGEALAEKGYRPR